MGLLTSAVAFLKGLLKLLLRLVLFPFRLPKKLWNAVTGIRTASPASKALLVVVFALAGVAGVGCLLHDAGRSGGLGLQRAVALGGAGVGHVGLGGTSSRRSSSAAGPFGASARPGS